QTVLIEIKRIGDEDGWNMSAPGNRRYHPGRQTTWFVQIYDHSEDSEWGFAEHTVSLQPGPLPATAPMHLPRQSCLSHADIPFDEDSDQGRISQRFLNGPKLVCSAEDRWAPV
ncbi:hypothetical protein, partial [Brevibacterium sp.]|uniref:hypothetical protein n=1 Tax=Brevibacterium sp. TaxID=1701 RepID=UPI002648BC6B